MRCWAFSSRPISVSFGGRIASSTSPPISRSFLRVGAPVIVAMWHGQHLMITYARTKSIARIAALIFAQSRRRPAGGRACGIWAIMPVRGSGGKPGQRPSEGRGAGAAQTEARTRRRRHGGIDRRCAEAAARRRPRHRHLGEAFGPADRPDSGGHQPPLRFRLLGPGQHRQAVRARRHCRRRSSFDVPADADDAALEVARRAVQSGLDEVHRRAYALVGARDPGAGLRPA